jgi:hypothetical protein
MTTKTGRLSRTLKALSALERIEKFNVSQCQLRLISLQQQMHDTLIRSDVMVKLTGTMRQIEKAVSQIEKDTQKCGKLLVDRQESVLRLRGLQNALQFKLNIVVEGKERTAAAIAIEDHVQAGIWQKATGQTDASLKR